MVSLVVLLLLLRFVCVRTPNLLDCDTSQARCRSAALLLVASSSRRLQVRFGDLFVSAECIDARVLLRARAACPADQRAHTSPSDFEVHSEAVGEGGCRQPMLTVAIALFTCSLSTRPVLPFRLVAMSGLSAAAKQQQLRQMMQQAKATSGPTAPSTPRVTDRLAKYDASGALSCAICKSAVAESGWTAHTQSKQHLQVRRAATPPAAGEGTPGARESLDFRSK